MLASGVQRPSEDRRFDSVGQNTTTPELLVRCGCGFEAQGIEEELILIVEEHAIEAHNVEVTEEQVLASMSRRA
jgi:predicted small metal-binding protein